MFGKSGKADAHFLLLPVKLDDGARKQDDEVALLDFGIHKIDGYVMEPSVHKAKIHAFSRHDCL